MAERVSDRAGERTHIEDLVREYEQILCVHLVEPAEHWRFSASDLGKRMVARGMGPEMLAAIHGEALRRCRGGAPALANEILLEAMLAFALEYYQRAELHLADKNRLAAHAKTLEGLNRDLLALQEEMSERNEQLRQSHAELGRLAAQKSDLLATVTHEIRTPLTAILGYGEFLEEGTYGELNPEQIEILHRMTQGGKDLLDLVNRILDLSRLEAGRLVLDRQPIHIEEAMAQASEHVRALALRKKLTLMLREIPPNLPLVWGDFLRVVEILQNLLGNAVKFTPEGGTIEVGAKPAGEWVEVWVRDTGPGIMPEEQRRVFEKYTQAAEGARRYGSSGLGLALCRELVNLHGGAIWVESEPARGATFWFTLPIWRESPAERAPLALERKSH
ncbi:MAG: hypothetical protein KGR26_01995 [Cyanobacteria bacterium REEB65]|nr:hypothetical protein [Cyanobacteria bacterium REEB65]